MTQGGYDPNQQQGSQPGGYDPNQQQGGYQQPSNSGYNQQPPQGGYGQQPPQGGQPGYTPPSFNQADMQKMMAAGRADLATLPSKWMKVLMSPSPQTFASELPNANWVAIVTNVLVAAVASGIIYLLLYLIFGLGFSYGIGVFFSSIWETLFQFAVGIAIAYAFSTYLFGGKGDPMQLAWAVSLYGVPLLIIRAILFAISLRFFSITLLGIITLLFWIAVFYYLWMALQAVFKMSSQNAMYAALSTLALPLLGAILSIFSISFLGGLMGGY
jgi:hypothetical protein